jgi:dienelactone hydrolase
MKSLLAAIGLAVAATSAHAKIVTQSVDYQHNGKPMKGYLAYDDAKSGPRAGVLVVQEWWGVNDYIKMRTRQMAQMGYVAFAPDMYGEGKVTSDPKEAGAWSGETSKDFADWVARAKAGIEILKKQPGVDAGRLGAMGFCFGGSTVLALAYSGEPLKGVVTFHGSLFAPNEQQRGNIKASIAILHGEADGFVKPETIAATKAALEAGNVDWYMVSYAKAVHTFTNPDADKYKIPGVAYNEKAATRSWAEMTRFFEERLK